MNETEVAVVVAGEEEDDHFWSFCYYGRISEGVREVV